MDTPKYEFELWQGNDTYVTEIGRFVQSARYSLRVNEPESLQFQLDMTAFERHCASISEDSRQALLPHAADVKVKRKGEYKFGVEITNSPWSITKAGAVINVGGYGYLKLLSKRHVAKSYAQVESTEIAWDLIDTTQTNGSNGDFGITQGLQQYETGVLRDRNYGGENNVKEYLQALTRLRTGTFDISFDAMRRFETWQRLGSIRNDVVLIYPSTDIIDISSERDADSLENYILGTGSGFGNETRASVKSDATSMSNFKRREGRYLASDISIQNTLDENTEAYRDEHKDLLEIPTIVARGERVFDELGLMLGDSIPLRVVNHPYAALSGELHRLYGIDVELDKNFAERVTLIFDAYDAEAGA